MCFPTNCLQCIFLQSAALVVKHILKCVIVLSCHFARFCRQEAEARSSLLVVIFCSTLQKSSCCSIVAQFLYMTVYDVNTHQPGHWKSVSRNCLCTICCICGKMQKKTSRHLQLAYSPCFKRKLRILPRVSHVSLIGANFQLFYDASTLGSLKDNLIAWLLPE